MLEEQLSIRQADRKYPQNEELKEDQVLSML